MTVKKLWDPSLSPKGEGGPQKDHIGSQGTVVMGDSRDLWEVEGVNQNITLDHRVEEGV